MAKWSKLPKWLRYTIWPVAACAVIAVVVAIIVGYFNFISEQSHSDGERNLKEVYLQVNNSYGRLIKRNWSILESCGDYIELSDNYDAVTPQKVTPKEFIKSKQEYWGFTDFYFLDENRNYYSFVNERQGAEPLANGPQMLIDSKRPIMTGEKIDNEKVTVFAIAADGTYNGFRYSAIGISYKNTDMAKALKNKPIFPRIRVEEDGKISYAVSCRHCEDPICVRSCISGALSVKDGAVCIDRERCVGCLTCVLVCPYGAVSQNGDGVVQKCELCLQNSFGAPACVQGCPNGGKPNEQAEALRHRRQRRRRGRLHRGDPLGRPGRTHHGGFGGAVPGLLPSADFLLP